MRHFFKRVISIAFLLLSSHQMFAMELSAKRVLSIGPGALLGYIKIQILEEMEKELGRPLIEVFDLMGGTSTGAVIVSLLSRGYSAKEVREFYENFSPEIFAQKTQSISDTLLCEDTKWLRMQILQNLFIKPLSDLKCPVNKSTIRDLYTYFRDDDYHRFFAIYEELLIPTAFTSLPSTSPYSEREDFLITIENRFNQLTNILTNNYFYDSDAFRLRLEEKLGAETLLNDTKIPIVLFAEKSTEGMSTTLKMRLQELFLGGYAEPNLATTVVGLNAASGIKLVDAVYASSAAISLFPPIEINYFGEIQTFSDGNKKNFSTLRGTYEEARKLWPTENLEVFFLSLGNECDPKAFDDKALTTHTMMSTINIDVTIEPRTNSSKENFALMRQYAKDYISSTEFAEIIRKLR